MQIGREDFQRVLGAIREVGDVVPLRQLVLDAFALLGIDKLFFMAPLTLDPRVGRVLTNVGCSPVWERHYRAGLFRIDPLPRLAMESAMAIFVPRDVDTGALDARERRYLALAGQHGLDRVIATATYGPYGRAGFYAALWPKAGDPPDDILLAIQMAGQVAFLKYCLLLRDDLAVEPLSDRETEVMRWMCRGKSNPVIGEILGLSRSSVDTYIRRIFAKLHVSDRTAACVRAYSLGYASSDEVENRVRRASELPGLAPMASTPRSD